MKLSGIEFRFLLVTVNFVWLMCVAHLNIRNLTMPKSVS